LGAGRGSFSIVKRVLFGLGLAALIAGPALAQTDVSGVEIRADNSVILRVAVSGDMGPKTVVVSDGVVGVNCGPDAYKYTEHENRQCWVWVRRSRPVVLSTKGMKGAQGRDWSVAWTGCEVLDDGAACRINPEKETNVSAMFKGVPQ
jgi:hypothetical protein